MKKKLLISASLLALLGGAVAVSGYAVAPLANQVIRQSGFPEAKISGLALTPTGALIEHISLDGNDFSTIDNINIMFGWWDFLSSGKIDSLTVKDISITAELDENNTLKIAGWDATLPAGSSGSALLPIRSLILQGITVDISTEQGDIQLKGKLSLDTVGEDKQSLQYALWGQQHQLSLDAKGSGTLQKNGDIALSTTLNDGRLNLPNIDLSRASGWIDYHKTAGNPLPTFSGQLVAGKVNTMGALLQNVTATIDTTKPESLFFKTSPAGHNDITLSGRWLSSKDDNHLEFTIDSQSSLELIKLLAPEEAENFTPWVKNANPLQLTLSAPLSALQQDNKAVAYSLKLGKDGSDIFASSAGKAAYQSSTEMTSVTADKTTIAIAGGQIDVAPFSFDTESLGKTALKTSVTLSRINMDELSQLADIDGLKAEGLLSGEVPLVYTDKGITFGDGHVKSEGTGVFSYTPVTFPSSLQGDDERMQTVRQALSNFHFTNLTFDISGPFTGKMKTTLKAEGTNPVFGDRPIQLNLNLDGDLGPVIQQTLQAGDIGGKIRSQLSGSSGAKK